MQRKPNFFLVGVGKAGTTSLYNYLDQHPQIYLSPVKEPQYLAEEMRFENFTDEMQQRTGPGRPALREYLQGPMSTRFSGGPVSEWPEYLKLFQHASAETAIGEASACYLWSKTAPQNIAAHFNDARIIMVLRDPVERAFSQYLHMLTFAQSRVSFREHVNAALSSNSTRMGELYPFLEFGLYCEQVQRYLALFPRDRIRIYFYEDYRQNPRNLLRDIFRFLSVEETFVPDLSQRHMLARVPRSYFLNGLVKRLGLWDVARSLGSLALRRVAFLARETLVLDPADRARLVDFYREDIQNLSSLLNRDLSAWLAGGPTVSIQV